MDDSNIDTVGYKPVGRRQVRRHSASGYDAGKIEFGSASLLDPLEISDNSRDAHERRGSLTFSMSSNSRSIISDGSVIDTAYQGERDRALEMIFDDPYTVAAYQSVPLIEIDRLPRGGISFDTKAVGRIQVRYFVCICLV